MDTHKQPVEMNSFLHGFPAQTAVIQDSICESKLEGIIVSKAAPSDGPRIMFTAKDTS